MLTQEDLYFNYKSLLLFCKFNVFPFTFDNEKAEVGFQNHTKRLLAWRLQLSSFVFLFSLKGYGLFSSIGSHTSTELSFSLLQLLMTGAMVFSVYVQLFMFHNKGPEFAALLSRRFNDVSGGNRMSGLKASLHVMTSKYFKQTMFEMVAITFPCSMILVAVFFFLLNLFDVTSPFMLYSFVPKAFENPIALLLVIALEFVLAVYLMAPFCIVVLPLVTLIPWTNANVFGYLKQGLRDKARRASLAHQGLLCSLLVKTQLEINAFNYIFADYNYLAKLCALSTGVLLTFSGIEFALSNPSFAIMAFCIGLNGMFSFLALFGSLYVIPDNIQRFKVRIIYQMKKQIRRSRGREVILKRLKGIPYCGVRAGNFYTLDRMTTLTFLGFVISQVGSLLIAFK